MKAVPLGVFMGMVLDYLLAEEKRDIKAKSYRTRRRMAGGRNAA